MATGGGIGGGGGNLPGRMGRGRFFQLVKKEENVEEQKEEPKPQIVTSIAAAGVAATGVAAAAAAAERPKIVNVKILMHVLKLIFFFSCHLVEVV